ncbi:MAG: metalloregulator ArsR/SmtB family transcription factor [Chlorobium sp.]|nr:metalloregulator ArsR/SmtB family transcription factor [Chlorobium sp.]MCW8815141.1 metalloregulator ArsR/SmtB family transcription factor [Chlorobium sp.]MCW8819078.1 metalloregulator ArsR/SmtB family transcription factor [Ignavibacteriaceae bacterium]
MDILTALFKALSDRNRLRIVSALLKHDELCACQLTELIHVTGATASRHMGVLISSGLVDSRKDGRWVYYRIRREQADFGVLIGWIESQLSHDPGIEHDAKTLDDITSCEPEDLCRKQRGDECCPKK